MALPNNEIQLDHLSLPDQVKDLQKQSIQPNVEEEKVEIKEHGKDEKEER